MEKDKRSESERTESVCGSALGRPAARPPGTAGAGRDAARAAGRGAAGRARPLPRSREARSTSKIDVRRSIEPAASDGICSVLFLDSEIGPVPTSPTPLLQGGIVFYFEGFTGR